MRKIWKKKDKKKGDLTGFPFCKYSKICNNDTVVHLFDLQIMIHAENQHYIQTDLCKPEIIDIFSKQQHLRVMRKIDTYLQYL